MGFGAQVEMFSNAKIIVGEHGAGLTNILFCCNAKIIELFPQGFANIVYPALASFGENKFSRFFGSSLSLAGWSLDTDAFLRHLECI